jgi:hypothetical protein
MPETIRDTSQLESHPAENGVVAIDSAAVWPGSRLPRSLYPWRLLRTNRHWVAAHPEKDELASGFGFAFGRSLTRKVAAMIELRTGSSTDFQRDRLVQVNAGIIDGVRNVVVYANIGHSVFSDDGGHFYAGGSFKIVIGR